MINAVPVQVGWLKCLFFALQQPDWSVRILIASTGSLVGSQYILISPHLPPQWGQAFQTLVSQCKMLTAKCLVRKHLGNSSSVGRNLTLMAQRTRHLRAWKRQDDLVNRNSNKTHGHFTSCVSHKQEIVQFKINLRSRVVFILIVSQIISIMNDWRRSQKQVDFQKKRVDFQS